MYRNIQWFKGSQDKEGYKKWVDLSEEERFGLEREELNQSQGEEDIYKLHLRVKGLYLDSDSQLASEVPVF